MMAEHRTRTLTPLLSVVLAAGALPAFGKGPGEAKPPAAMSRLVSEHTVEGHNIELTHVTLYDQTDRHDELVRLDTIAIMDHSTHCFTGSIFVVENKDTQQGVIFVRQSPMPISRPLPPEKDLELSREGEQVTVRLYRADYEPEKNLWQQIPYQGGVAERIHALQMWQRSLRPDTPLYRTPTFIINTWGDRSRDARISEAFILKELESASEIGADAVRIDDGWQTGLSGNSAFQGEMKTKGLTGFWSVSDSFWNVNKERFPNGLAPVLEKAKETGVEIGLWYAPDSNNQLENWERDADTILELHKTFGIRLFKIDGLDVETPLAQTRVSRFLSKVTEESNHETLLMLDITGNHKRPGFLGAIPYGNLYVENRYTDWGNYWPHRTLRSLWRLSHWVDPLRLRFETLNNTRKTNNKKYKGNPLAPANYPADYLFASVMFSNPLGFYESSNLPEDYKAALAPLVRTWRQHRHAMFESSIIPIGQEPSGHSWTGFMSCKENRQANYVVCLREFSEEGRHLYQLPVTVPEGHTVNVLSGEGRATVNGDQLEVMINTQPGYLFMKIEPLPSND